MELKDWIRAQEREERWEECLRRSPVCVDCGRRVPAGKVLPICEDGSFGCLCPDCVRDRMVPVEEMG